MAFTNITRIFVYLMCFAVCFVTLTSVDFSRFIYTRKVQFAQLLLVLLSMALAYLVAQFIFGLAWN